MQESGSVLEPQVEVFAAASSRNPRALLPKISDVTTLKQTRNGTNFPNFARNETNIGF